MTTVCIIRGEVTIVWSVDGVEFRSTRGIDVSSYSESSVVYVANYTIPHLNASDNGKIYQCKLMIADSSVLVAAVTNITISLSGKWVCIVCVHIY